MQAYRSTSLALSSGSRFWLQSISETSTEAAVARFSPVIQHTRNLHGNVDITSPQHPWPPLSHNTCPILQTRPSQLVLGNRRQSHALPRPFSASQPWSSPPHGPTLARCQPPTPCSIRSYSSSLASSGNSHSGQLQFEVQRFLRQKGVDFTQTHACLK